MSSESENVGNSEEAHSYLYTVSASWYLVVHVHIRMLGFVDEIVALEYSK